MWLIYALLAAILWGLNYALSERLLGSISPVSLLAIEMTSGAVFFSLISYATTLKKDWHTLMTEPDLWWITLLEVFVLLIASFCIVVSIREKNATAAGIVELIYPLFTILFSWLFFRQYHANASLITGGILIFLGVLVISR